MVKKTKKVYLETKDIRKLKSKARAFGIEGRGWLSKLFRKMAAEPFIILDQDAKALLRSIDD